MQKALKDLHELLGHEVLVEPEWQLLLAELGDAYPDKANFVVVVAGCVEAWAKSMTELLDDAAHEDWTETVLERAKSVSHRLRLFLDAASSSSASTTWSEQRGGFVLALPKTRIVQPAELFPVFRGALLTCFDKKPVRQAVVTAATAAADEWADVEMDTATGTPQVVDKAADHQPTTLPAQGSSTPRPARPAVEFLPSTASLPRPDELFLRPPYHLSLLPLHKEVEIQCSHSPTLKIIADYFGRWCRVNHRDTREVSSASPPNERKGVCRASSSVCPNRHCSVLPFRSTSASPRSGSAKCSTGSSSGT